MRKDMFWSGELFQKLFMQGKPADIAANVEALRQDRSLLDFVGEQSKRLTRSLSQADQQRMDQYFSSVRELEQRLHNSEAWEHKPKPAVAAKPPDDIEDQKELRNAYGHFFYRFREGESGSDVYDRISSFMETLYRHWSKPSYAPNALFVTHGLTMRLFCMRWFHWSVEYFESLNNPNNAEVRTLVRTELDKYELDIPFTQWVQRRVGNGPLGNN